MYGKRIGVVVLSTGAWLYIADQFHLDAIAISAIHLLLAWLCFAQGIKKKLRKAGGL